MCQCFDIHIVPGIRDNARRGIRRNKFRLTGGDVRTIFEPVVKEVISLIEGQIKATQTDVKAVLLVGGLGQNTYLRERIRKAISVEVMQSPNGYEPRYLFGWGMLTSIVGPLLFEVR